MKIVSRRKFFKAGGIGLLGAYVAQPTFANNKLGGKPDFPKKLTILLQGDSITDAGRNRGRYYANDVAGMGMGYVYQIVAELQGSLPDKSWKFYNRGISGNKVYQLAERWDDDCLQLQPDVLSILIGVNDFWHTLNKYNGTVDIYERDFRALLDRTKNRFPDLKIIIGEPFALKGGRAIDKRWYPEFPKYQRVARQIAKDYHAAFIPYQSIFEKAMKSAPVAYWSHDGVHPTMAGGYLMKEAWINTFKTIY